MSRDKLIIEVRNRRIEIPLRFVKMNATTKFKRSGKVVGPELVISAIGMNKRVFNKWAKSVFNDSKKKDKKKIVVNNSLETWLRPSTLGFEK